MAKSYPDIRFDNPFGIDCYTLDNLYLRFNKTIKEIKDAYGGVRPQIPISTATIRSRLEKCEIPLRLKDVKAKKPPSIVAKEVTEKREYSLSTWSNDTEVPEIDEGEEDYTEWLYHSQTGADILDKDKNYLAFKEFFDEVTHHDFMEELNERLDKVNKVTFCPFCGKPYARLARHLPRCKAHHKKINHLSDNPSGHKTIFYDMKPSLTLYNKPIKAYTNEINKCIDICVIKELKESGLYKLQERVSEQGAYQHDIKRIVNNKCISVCVPPNWRKRGK